MFQEQLGHVPLYLVQSVCKRTCLNARVDSLGHLGVIGCTLPLAVVVLLQLAASRAYRTTTCQVCFCLGMRAGLP